MKKKKKDYSNLCYFSLVMLGIFLLIPPVFRWVGKDWYKKEEKKSEVIEILVCTKDRDSIRSSFLGGEPQNLDYKFKGEYTLNKTDDNITDKSSVKDNKNNAFIDFIASYAKITYLADEGVTRFKVSMDSLKQSEKYMEFFNTIANQKSYFNSLSFYCEVTKS